MVTGDHPVTALAIARDLDLASSAEEVVTGSVFAAADADEVPDLVERSRVFARIAPHQKLEIVEAAQAVGHFVAVTGDGVNDGAGAARGKHRRCHGSQRHRRCARGRRAGHYR